MAWLFDNTADYLSRTTSLPSSLLFTACGWGLLTADTNTWNTIFALQNGTGTQYCLLATSEAGTDLGLWGPADGDPTSPVTLTPGTWFFWGISRNTGGVQNGYYGLVGASALTVMSLTDATTVTPNTMKFGNDNFNEVWNGRVAAIKVWDAVLTADELLLEMRQYVPVRLLNIHLWSPGLLHTDVTDYSGNARTLTVGGTLATEDGPPIPWMYSRKLYAFIPSGAGGTLYTETLGSSVTAASTVVKSISKALSGSITISSAVSKTINKAYSGSIVAVSSIVKSVAKILQGSITAASAITTSATRSVTLASSITASSAISKKVDKVISSSIVAVSTVVRNVSKVLLSSITAVSSLVPSALRFITASGSIIAVSAVSKSVNKVLSGSVVGQSSFSKVGDVVVSGSIAAATQIVKVASKVVSSSITAVSSVVATTGVTERVFEASVTAVSAVVKRVDKAVGNSVTVTSSVSKIAVVYFVSTVVIASSVVKEIRKVLSNSITMQSAVAVGKVTALVFNSSITIVSALVTQFIQGSGVVTRTMWLYIRRNRRS